MKTRLINIESIRVGDIVIREGKPTTVSGNNIKKSRFMGTTIFGDSYRIGTVPVELVIELEGENNGEND